LISGHIEDANTAQSAALARIDSLQPTEEATSGKAGLGISSDLNPEKMNGPHKQSPKCHNQQEDSRPENKNELGAVTKPRVSEKDASSPSKHECSGEDEQRRKPNRS
jgi:hypothetical protein